MRGKEVIKVEGVGGVVEYTPNFDGGRGGVLEQ